MKNPFRYFDSSLEVIRLVVMLYIKYPLSLCNVEDLLAERGIDICHETVRLWWSRFGPMFAAEIRGKRVDHMQLSYAPARREGAAYKGRQSQRLASASVWRHPG